MHGGLIEHGLGESGEFEQIVKKTADICSICVIWVPSTGINRTGVKGLMED
jgi:hypothetical protein